MNVELVDKPERTQSQILLGHPAPRWVDPDFLPLSVAATAFGGTFTARLMTEVRVKRGLSYGASCRLGQAHGARPVVLAVAPSLEQTPETLELVLGMWRDWVSGGVSDEEVAFARSYLAQSFAFQIATADDRLDLATEVEVCGLPSDYARRQVEAIEAVTPAAVRAAMRRRLRERDLAVTIVTTARALRPKIAGKIVPASSIRVTPYDEY
jgi:zinc protease